MNIAMDLDSPKMITSYHEAGHAVASVMLHRPFRYVTMRARGDDHFGAVVFPRRRSYLYPDGIIFLAGTMAENQYLSEANLRTENRIQESTDGCYSDLEEFIDLCPGMSMAGRRRIMVKTMDKVETWWPEIEHVAAALRVSTQALTFRQVREICGSVSA